MKKKEKLPEQNNGGERGRTRHQIIPSRWETSKKQETPIESQTYHQKIQAGVQTLAGPIPLYNGTNKNSSNWLASASPERSSLREAQRTDPQAQTKNMFPRARQKQDPCFCARRKGTGRSGPDRSAPEDVWTFSAPAKGATSPRGHTASLARTHERNETISRLTHPPTSDDIDQRGASRPARRNETANKSNPVKNTKKQETLIAS